MCPENEKSVHGSVTAVSSLLASSAKILWWLHLTPYFWPQVKGMLSTAANTPQIHAGHLRMKRTGVSELL